MKIDQNVVCRRENPSEHGNKYIISAPPLGQGRHDFTYALPFPLKKGLADQ